MHIFFFKGGGLCAQIQVLVGYFLHGPLYLELAGRCLISIPSLGNGSICADEVIFQSLSFIIARKVTNCPCI